MPTREHLVKKIQNILGDIPVSYDTGKGIWDNRVKSMLMFDPNCEFHCVLQDDAIPCEDFYNEVDKIVTEQKAYSLYFGNRKNMQDIGLKAIENGGVEMDWLSWGVAIVLPTKIIPSLIKYWEGKRSLLKNDDTRIARYLKEIGMNVYYPIPSLVEHNHLEKSIIDPTGEHKNRKAFKFKG